MSSDKDLSTLFGILGPNSIVPNPENNENLRRRGGDYRPEQRSRPSGRVQVEPVRARAQFWERHDVPHVIPHDHAKNFEIPGFTRKRRR